MLARYLPTFALAITAVEKKTQISPSAIMRNNSIYAHAIYGRFCLNHWSIFLDEAGYNVTVNGERYRAMINDFFVSELEDNDVTILGFNKKWSWAYRLDFIWAN